MFSLTAAGQTIGVGTVAAGAAMAATLFRPEKSIIHNSA